MAAMTLPYVTASPERAERLSRIAGVLRVQVVRIHSISELEPWLRANEAMGLLTDADLADGGWRDVMECRRMRAPGLPVVVTARTDSASIWAEVAEAGAMDFIAQPFYAPEVRRCLQAVRETAGRELLAEASI